MRVRQNRDQPLLAAPPADRQAPWRPGNPPRPPSPPRCPPSAPTGRTGPPADRARSSGRPLAQRGRSSSSPLTPGRFTSSRIRSGRCRLQELLGRRRRRVRQAKSRPAVPGNPADDQAPGAARRPPAAGAVCHAAPPSRNRVRGQPESTGSGSSLVWCWRLTPDPVPARLLCCAAG